MKKQFLPLALSLTLCSGLIVPAFAAEKAPSYTASGTVVKVENAGSDSQYVTVRDKDDNIVGTGIVSGGSGEVYILEGTDTSDLTVKNEVTGEEIEKGSSNNNGGSTNRPSNRPSGGGGGGGSSSSSDKGDRPSLKIKGDDHGDVTVSPRNPEKGQKVTITVKPDSGYILDELKVTADGDPVRLTEKGDNVFTFTMPGDDIVVSATFKPGNATPTIPERSHFFYDVSSTDWFAAAVAFVSENGMMAGNNNKFSPNDRLTRGMMAQILYNLDGGSGSGSGYFPDVSPSDWFAGAVAWASSQSLMDGYGSGNFGPNDPITREQLASILYRYASAKGYNTGASGDLSAFADGANTSSWASASVRWAVGSGLLSGKSGNRLDPAGAATRAEVAQILMNFHTQVAD